MLGIHHRNLQNINQPSSSKVSLVQPIVLDDLRMLDQGAPDYDNLDSLDSEASSQLSKLNLI